MGITLKSLQNGSDIRGVAMEGVNNEPVNLTTDATEKIASAFAKWLCTNKRKKCDELKIAIGRDSRLSGPSLLSTFASVLYKKGISVYDCELSTTPAMFMATKFNSLRCDGSVMITASHLPFNRNGFKFFTQDGGLNKNDISEILEVADNIEVPAINSYEIPKYNLIDEYARFLKKTIVNGSGQNKPLSGLHIIVDAGNGSGGFFAEKILKELGAQTNGSLFLEPEGNFPNHAPNPEDSKAIKTLQDTVVNMNADLGIIFDTDVDRSAIVGASGNAINRNRLIALMAAIILEEHPKSYIVTDSVTSDGLSTFIEENNGIHHRFKRGYKNVINEGIRLNKEGKECWLAIETSGHAALRENYFLDDGAFLIAKILIKIAELRNKKQSIESLIKSLKEPIESEEYRIKIITPDFKTYGNTVIEKLINFIDSVKGWNIVPDNHEGVRIQCGKDHGDGWFLLRLSLHDPVLPLNIESNEKGGILFILNILKTFFNEFKGLDIAALH